MGKFVFKGFDGIVILYAGAIEMGRCPLNQTDNIAFELKRSGKPTHVIMHHELGVPHIMYLDPNLPDMGPPDILDIELVLWPEGHDVSQERFKAPPDHFLGEG